MEYTGKKTLFAVKRGDEYVGLYSSEENARAHGIPEEVTALLIEGSPDSEHYVCQAEAVLSTLFRSGNSFQTEYHDAGPVWGVNMQSAVAQLLGYGVRKKNLELSVLRIYEIDKDYSDDLPANLAREYGFIVDKLLQEDAPAGGALGMDYIASYFEIQRCNAERARKYESKHTQMILDELRRAVFAGKRVRCGNTYKHFDGYVRRALCHYYSLEELKIVAALLGLEASDEISEKIADGSISEDEAASLLERLQKCLPGKRKSGS